MKIFCWFGLHDWLWYMGLYHEMHVCRNCQKEQYLEETIKEKWVDVGSK